MEPPGRSPRKVDTVATKGKDSDSNQGKVSWFSWSANQGGNGAGIGLSAGSRSDGGGNIWTRSDGSSGRSVTRTNSDGTSTNHIVERDAGERHGRASDHTFSSNGRDVGSPRHYRTKR